MCGHTAVDIFPPRSVRAYPFFALSPGITSRLRPLVESRAREAGFFIAATKRRETQIETMNRITRFVILREREGSAKEQRSITTDTSARYALPSRRMTIDDSGVKYWRTDGGVSGRFSAA